MVSESLLTSFHDSLEPNIRREYILNDTAVSLVNDLL